MVIRKRYRDTFNFLEHPRMVLTLKKHRLVRAVSFHTKRSQDVIRHILEQASRA